MRRYDYLTGKKISEEKGIINFKSPYKYYHCEKCGKKGDTHSVGMDLTIFGYFYLCTDCANQASEACMMSCPEHYGFENVEEVHGGYRHLEDE